MAYTGRNDPCPCGSGKKYKKCCIDSNENTALKDTFGKRARKRGDDIIPMDEVIDYGKPCLDDYFFATYNLHDISGLRLLYSLIINPHVEVVAHTSVRRALSRGHDEEDRIKKADSVEILIEIMKRNPDPINHAPLMDSLVQKKEQAVSLILLKLMEPQNDSFVELAAKILHRIGNDYSDKIIRIIRTGKNNRAYAISVLCILLGFYNNNESEKLLWDYYHYMKDTFPHETYSEGPLLGLIEMQERKKKRLYKTDDRHV